MTGDDESRGSSLDDSSLSQECTPESDDENGPLADLVSRMTPHLICDPKIAKNRLKTLGVKKISKFLLVKETDILDIMEPVGFRELCIQLKERAESRNIRSSKEYVLNLKHVLSSKLMVTMNGTEPMTDLERRNVIDAVGDDIEENMRVVREEQVQNMSTTLIKSHAKAFGCIQLDDEEVMLAAHNLKKSLMYRINYKRRKSSQNSNEPKRKRPRFSSREEYGLQGCLDLPALSATDNAEELDIKRRSLIGMFESDVYDLNCVKRLMAETSVLQRHDINRKLHLQEIKTRWPFIGQTNILEEHFFSLMGIESSTVDETLKTVPGKFLKYFSHLSTKKRKGAAKDIPDKIHKILQVYHQNKENNKGTDLLAVILCIIRHLQLPQKALFLMFEDTASYQEVQSSNLSEDGCPLIAVMGSSFFSQSTVAYVVVDNVVLWEKPMPLLTALHVMFMCYFVFKISYNPLVAPALEFIQRNIYNIRDAGSRVARKKSKNGHYSHAVKDVTPKYSSLLKNFKEYTSKYNFDD
ncbi:uncharacterized protein LOC113214105 [Frankliniella occidentalis]|uniref:Uncharacterized protein LOC113214105 n=1 Tax=Frankliniella occidentalis TaxID=133901 RepID=A0A6J1TE78_FRAOC|nr:uncharacterized protein LOC113214105 [Frankliniella occidentalis]